MSVHIEVVLNQTKQKVSVCGGRSEWKDSVHKSQSFGKGKTRRCRREPATLGRQLVSQAPNRSANAAGPRKKQLKEVDVMSSLNVICVFLVISVWRRITWRRLVHFTTTEDRYVLMLQSKGVGVLVVFILTVAIN